MQGTVKFFNQDKGFGFISREGQADVFVHQTNVAGERILAEGQAVEFEVGVDVLPDEPSAGVIGANGARKQSLQIPNNRSTGAVEVVLQPARNRVVINFTGAQTGLAERQHVASGHQTVLI